VPLRESSDARRRILDTAARLFLDEGVRSVGINRIVEESDVALMTLYRHFPSRDALIEAVIQDQDRGWRERTLAIAGSVGDEPAEQILAIFDALAAEVRSPRCPGCIFQSTGLALAEPTHPASRAVRANKRWLRGLLRKLAQQCGAPANLGDQLMLLYEGALISRVLERDRDAGASARAAARGLLAAVASPGARAARGPRAQRA
jgi:AcrR family transcriptional regulator